MTDRSTPARRFLSTAAMGATLALALGVFEAAYRLAGRPLTPRLPDVTIGFFWLLPAGMVLLLAPIILGVAAGRALRPARITAEGAFFALAVLPVFSLSLLLFRESLHDLAHLCLALGLTSAVTRLVRRRSEGVTRRLALAAPLLALVPLVTVVAVTVGRDRQESASVAALPSPPPEAPNVLLVVWDTVRAQELSLHGYAHQTTPRLDARAATGIVFDRAYSTAPWTLPSHASMFTGRIMQDLVTDWVTPLGDEPALLAEALASAGYHTGGFTANRIATTRGSGLARGFHHYEDFDLRASSGNLLGHHALSATLRKYPPLGGHWRLSPPMKDAREVTDSFVTWLDGHQRPGPFFAFLNYFNAHEVYQFPEAYRDRFPVDGDQSHYDAAIAYQDDELERLLTLLADRGALDQTVVILTSDHGEAFGEHGLVGHGGNLYTEQLHVPLIIWPTGGAAVGLRVETPVSTREIAATVADLALGRADDHPFDGQSLSRFWRGAAAAERDDIVLSGAHRETSLETARIRFGNMTSAVVGAYHYILDGNGVEELYDVTADPYERSDLAADPARQPFLETLRRSLARLLAPEWRPGIAEPAR